MNDLPFASIPPTAQHLARVRHGDPIDEPDESSVDEFVFSANPFSHTLSPQLIVKERDSSFGFTFATDKLCNRAYVSKSRRKVTPSDCSPLLGVLAIKFVVPT